MLPFMILYIISVQWACPVPYATSFADCLAKYIISDPVDHYDDWFQEMYGLATLPQNIRIDGLRHWLERI